MVIDLSLIILITIFGDREIFNHTMRLFQYFLNVFVILHVGVLPSYSKSVITPTYTPEIVALSVCDIISLSIQGVAGVICYTFSFLPRFTLVIAIPSLWNMLASYYRLDFLRYSTSIIGSDL